MSNEYLNNKMFEGIIARFQQSKRDRARHRLILEDLIEQASHLSHRGIDMTDDALRIDEHKRLTEVADRDFTSSQKQLATAFYMLSDNIVKFAKFNLIDADDAVQEGVMICFEKIDRFNPNKGKAFNYMTTCVFNHLRQLYRTSRNYNELKRRYQEFNMAQNTNNGRMT